MGSWRRPLLQNGSRSSSPASSPEPPSPAHGRAAEFIDRFAEANLARIFGDFPGKEHLVGYLHRRSRRELAKMTPEKLEEFLRGLEGLMAAVRTGEHFQELLTEASRPEVEIA